MQRRSIIGHGDVLSVLERAHVTGALSHAYLLVGPAHVGKAAVALWLAQRITCTGAEPPCGVCAPCVHCARGTYPDLFRIGDGASPIPVDDARAWTGALGASSLFAGWKVGIVEGSEWVREAAASALLKFLEEPPPRTVLLLTATHAQRVLPTMVSRCAVLRLHRVPAPVIADALVERGLCDDDTARALARAADGCPGVALTLADDAGALAARRDRHAALTALTALPYADRLREVAALTRALPEDRAAARQETGVLLAVLQQVARERLRTDATRAPALAPTLQAIARAHTYLAGNVPPRLIIESVALAFPRA